VAYFNLLKNKIMTAINEMPGFGQASTFDKISRSIWDELRQEDSPPLCGDFVNESHTAGINFKSLIEFIKNYNPSNKQLFNWADYEVAPTIINKTKREYNYYTFQWDDKPYTETQYNNIPFETTNAEGKVVPISLNGILNKRVCYLDSQKWGFQTNINAQNKKTSLALEIYFENTESERTYSKQDGTFTINDIYRAIQISSDNVDNVIYAIEYLYGNGYSKNVKDKVAKYYAEELKKTVDADGLNFLYKNAPDFVLQQLSTLLGDTLQFQHLQILFAMDDNSMFDDSSKATIKLMRSFNHKVLYETFRNYAYDLKRIFYNLDKESNAGDDITVASNKTNFANFMMALCYYNSFDGYVGKDRHKGKIDTFYFGEGYKVDSNIFYDNDTFKDKYFLQQFYPKYPYGPVDDIDIIGTIERSLEDQYVPAHDGDYHPFEPVWYVNMDAEDKTPQLVPAIYVKALAHQNEVGDIMQDIRIGANILALVLGVLTLGTASPLLFTLALIDITVATVDLVVIAKEKELMETEEGRDFLRRYNNFVLLASIPSVAILGRGLLVNGARLLGKVSAEASKNFLRSCMLKILLEINIANFTKNTVKIINYAEVWKAAGALNRITKELEDLGVLFVKGEVAGSIKAEEQLALIYKGEVIGFGTKQQLDKFLINWAKKTGNKLVNLLEDLAVKTAVFRRVSTNGFRGELALTRRQVKDIIAYAKKYGLTRTNMTFTDNLNTSYSTCFGMDLLQIGTDVMPSLTKFASANSRISWKGCIAHELAGHRAAALVGKTHADLLLEEVQASIRASMYGLDLTTLERETLMLDALERLEKNNLKLENIKQTLWLENF
jgi:hypothetical protein